MVNEFKAKEVARLTNILSDLKGQMAGVEEKYRKMAEEENKEMNEIFVMYSNVLKNLDPEATVPESTTVTVEIPVKKRHRRTKAEMEAARAAEAANATEVIDTIFPENNEPEDEEVQEEQITGEDFNQEEEEDWGINGEDDIISETGDSETVEVEDFPELQSTDDSEEESMNKVELYEDDHETPDMPNPVEDIVKDVLSRKNKHNTDEVTDNDSEWSMPEEWK